MVLKEINIDEYTALAYPNIGVFGSKEWLSVYDNLTFVGIYIKENQLAGGFYYVKTKKFGFNFIKTPPYIPHCGLFFINESKNQSSRSNTSKDVLAEVCSYIMAQKAGLCMMAFPSQITDMQAFIWNKYKVIPNYTYRIDLTQSFEDIKSNFESKNRNRINKAVKENVLVEENCLNNQQQYEYFSNFLNSTGANTYENVLKNIITKFANKSNSFSLTAKHNNQVVGNVFCVYDNNTCYYLLGGIDKSAGVGGVSNLLVQSSIEKAQKLGCKVFDFEGSMIPGVEMFFRSFGGKLEPYYTINKALLPIELLLKFKKREIF